MAYNLQSLVQILEQTLHPDQQQFVLDDETTTQLATLLEKAVKLKANLENYPLTTIKRIEGLESRITEATYKAEDIIESYVVDRILLRTKGESENGTKIVMKRGQAKSHKCKGAILRFLTKLCKKKKSEVEGAAPLAESIIVSPLDLGEVIDKMDSAIDTVMKIEDQTLNISFTSVSFTPKLNSNKFVVGLDDDLFQLKEQLTGSQSKLEFIAIAGMGGIGKTTLAHHLYNDPLVIYYFDLCAWVTISQEYNVKVILQCLVGCVIRMDTDDLLKMNYHQLGDALYKSLSGKRYLIVLDDVWTTSVWDEIHMFFPNDNNGSRIVITTRDLNVTKYANLSNSYHQMNLLNEFQSWSLLTKKVFGDKSCPPTLEKIGRKIATNCRGLPLAIQVIGGLLSESPKREVFWERVANDVSTIVAGDDQQFSKILSLSYDHLPHHLRPCFLYLASFSADQEIQATKLLRLWVAEGFLVPIAEKTLEEAAEVYLKELVERNLLFVSGIKSNGKVESYVIHDMVRDLCMRKAIAEKFAYNIINRKPDNVTEGTYHSMRRVSFHRHFVSFFNPIDAMPMPLLRSFLFFDFRFGGHISMFPILRLLRVLDVFTVIFDTFPKEVLQLVNIRYLALSLRSDVPSSLSRLWNLQTFIFRGYHIPYTFRIAVGILGSPQIRHVKLKGPSYLRTKGYIKGLIFETLQTLSVVSATEFGDQQFTERIQNLKNLGIDCDYFEVVDLSCLHKLEALKCTCCDNTHSAIFLSCLTFSPSIKKLTLRNCRLPSVFMSTVGLLPNLEVLKLRECYFVDQDMEKMNVWDPTEGEFLSLQYLLLEELELVHWQATETHFPKLRHLVIRRCSKLEEIPRGIGDIPTLEIIELYYSPLAVASAREILEEQCDLGNFTLRVRIHESEIDSLWAVLH